MLIARPTAAALYTAPTVEPVEVGELRTFCRIDGADLDTLLADAIVAARDLVERHTQRALLSQTWDFTFDRFADVLELPHPPLRSVSYVKYYDTLGVQQTLATSVYETALKTGVPILRLKYQQEWPTLRGHADDVQVRAVMGYGTTADDVPPGLRFAVRFLAAHYVDNPELLLTGTIQSEIPFTARHLLDTFRVRQMVG